VNYDDKQQEVAHWLDRNYGPAIRAAGYKGHDWLSAADDVMEILRSGVPQLPTKVGSLVANSYDKVFFLTDKGWIGISGSSFYPALPYAEWFTILHEGTEDPQ